MCIRDSPWTVVVLIACACAFLASAIPSNPIATRTTTIRFGLNCLHATCNHSFLMSFIAVSYTHLDVYKRQICGFVSGIPSTMP